MLPSLVIKIEYCRALHRGSKEPSRPGSLSCPTALENAPISRFLATKTSSISDFAAAFLTETASHSEMAVTRSKQTGGTFLTETRIAHSASRVFSRGEPLGLREGAAFHPELRRAAVPSLVCPGEERSFRAGRHGFRMNPDRIHPERIHEGRDVAFLTGSAPQTEFDVTHSKQTLEKILTGARMHIKGPSPDATASGGIQAIRDKRYATREIRNGDSR